MAVHVAAVASSVAASQAITRKGKAMCSEVSEQRLSVASTVKLQVKDMKLETYWKEIDQNQDKLVERFEMRDGFLVHSKKLLKEQLKEEECDLLMNFLDGSEDGSIGLDDFHWGVSLWYLWSENKADWGWASEPSMTLVRMRQLLKALNHGLKVSLREAEWVMDMADAFNVAEAMRPTALGLAVAHWYLTPPAPAKNGLNRLRLIERLEIEHRLQTGALRLFNVVIMFFLLTEAFLITGQADKCRGIKDTLYAEYNLEEVPLITSLDGVREYMKFFSRASANLVPLSSTYFLDGSEYLLLQGQQTFTSATRLPTVDLLMAQEFSLQVWVRVDDPDFVPSKPGIPLLRKALGNRGDMADLSCWSWNFPPGLSFGAHDYGGMAPDPATGLSEEFIYAPDYNESAAPFPERSSLVLHTLIVKRDTVQFLVGPGKLVGESRLPRPVTDCDSFFLTVGAPGISLAELRYYPRALTSQQVIEIHQGGATMTEIGYNVPPLKIETLSNLEIISQDVKENGQSIEAGSTFVQTIGDRGAALTAGAVVAPPDRPAPYNNPSHQPTFREKDPTLGYPYWSIYEDPVYTLGTSQNDMRGDALPGLTEDGFTVSAWLKFQGSGYLMAKALPKYNEAGETYWDNEMCWMMWIGAGSLFRFRVGQEKYESALDYSVADNEAPEEWQFRDRVFRHWVFRVNPRNSTHPLMICIDGSCGHHFVDYDPTRDLPKIYGDCDTHEDFKAMDPALQAKKLQNSRIWLNRRPPGAWGLTGTQMNFKYFNRSLTDAEVIKLFHEDPDPVQGGSLRQKQGCMTLEEQKDDAGFRDSFGHDCYWYFRARSQPGGENVCKLNPAAMKGCPIACLASEICWGSSAFSGASMQIWSQQMEFRHKGPHGTMCIAKSSTAEKEAIRCAANAPVNDAACAAAGVKHCGPKDCSTFEGDREALLECLSGVIWVAEGNTATDPFFPCTDIIKLEEPSCAWDDTDLEEVGNAIADKGVWSISFWFESLMTGCIQPQIRLLNGEGALFSYLGPMSGSWKAVPALEHPMGDGCDKGVYTTHFLMAGKEHGYRELPSADIDTGVKPSPGERHMMVMGRMEAGQTRLHFNTDFDIDFGGTPSAKPSHGRNFLRIINVLGDIRMSPLKLSSHFPTNGEVSQAWYAQMAQEGLKQGPAMPLQDQLVQRRNRRTGRFTRKTTLVTPPLIIQQRRKAGPCSLAFSDVVIGKYVSDAEKFHCSQPYSCDAQLSPESMYQCPSDVDETEQPFFGILPDRFEDGEAYVEFLTTVADHAIVVRRRDPREESAEMQLFPTDEFLDTKARSVTLAALFYSLEFGITTDLRIVFDTTGGRVRANPLISHYVATSADLLPQFLLIQGLNGLNMVILFLDTLWTSRTLLSEWKAMGSLHYPDMFGVVLNVSVLILMLVLMLQVVPYRLDSAANTEELIGKVVELDWANDASYSDKRGVYLTLFEDVAVLVKSFNDFEIFGMMISMMLLMRMVLATSVHPRIALVTQTLKYALSEMFHFFLIFWLIFLDFGRIASWRYGTERDDLSTTWKAMLAQFDSILDPPGSLMVSGGDSLPTDYVVFAILFHGICFFFLTNFILAIIVGAYTRVMEQVEICEVEQNIVSDLWSLITARFGMWRYTWPDRVNAIIHLQKMNNTFVQATDMAGCMLGEGHEDRKRQADAYYKFYEQYDFLTDCEEEEHARDKDPVPHLQVMNGSLSVAQRKVDLLRSDMMQQNMELRARLDSMETAMQQLLQVCGKLAGQHGGDVNGHTSPGQNHVRDFLPPSAPSSPAVGRRPIGGENAADFPGLAMTNNGQLLNSFKVLAQGSPGDSTPPESEAAALLL
eukprot:TRINITY_DN21781_c0_g1_i2.p1 TRINITY_DN21781_c0_g1~~TRINITY_DN21781_c0_g1_i2.p1  ORF type:complete len:1832 (-),score=331.79 TRINITY_DN21781_c0_g1_i2:226-5721(-)